MLKFIFLYLLSINITLFLIMAVDKRKARTNQWRVRESRLFVLGLLGGGPGGLAAMFLFHHKTRKPFFYFFFILGILIWAAILCLLLLPQ